MSEIMKNLHNELCKIRKKQQRLKQLIEDSVDVHGVTGMIVHILIERKWSRSVKHKWKELLQIHLNGCFGSNKWKQHLNQIQEP